jgi:hypothetical protein
MTLERQGRAQKPPSDVLCVNLEASFVCGQRSSARSGGRSAVNQTSRAACSWERQGCRFGEALSSGARPWAGT